MEGTWVSKSLLEEDPFLIKNFYFELYVNGDQLLSFCNQYTLFSVCVIAASVTLTNVIHNTVNRLFAFQNQVGAV